MSDLDYSQDELGAMENIDFYQKQNESLGKQLARVETDYQENKHNLLKAIKINSYRIKILKLEQGFNDD